MGVFDRSVAQVTRQIKKYGELVTWKQVVQGAPTDLDKPWEPGTPIETEHLVKIVFLPILPGNKQWKKYLSETEVIIGNTLGLMAAGELTFVPDLKDVVIRDSKQLSINSVNRLAPNGQNILWWIDFNE